MDPLKIFVSHSHEDNAFCQQLVRALRGAGADAWFDEHDLGAGHLLDAVERELRQRPIFLLILSPAAMQSQWVRNEAIWAFNRMQRDPQRVFLPVVAQPVDADTLWLFIESFKRIEAPGGIPYPIEEAIQRTLHALALNRYEQGAPPAGSSADDLILQGNLLFQQGRYQQAYDVLQQAVQLQPGATQGWYFLGFALHDLGRNDEALAALNQALALNPTSAADWTGKGAILWRLKRYPEALEAVDTALTIDPKQAFAWGIRGNALLFLKRCDEALAAYERATALEPDSARFWYNKSYALVWLRHYHAALIAAETSLELDSQSFQALVNKGWALLGLHRFEDALSMCQQALDIDPHEIESWQCGGYALRCLHRLDEAKSWEEQACVLAQQISPDPIPFTMEDDLLIALR